MKSQTGYIYILTNPSFPEYVKIGYADNVETRLKQLNRSECTPYAFRVYATYKVNVRLTDIKIHDVIDKLNPSLRSIDNIDGKKRVREFYAMSPEDAYSILEAIAQINGLEDNLILVEPSSVEKNAENEAEEIRQRKSPEKLPKMDWLIEKGIVKLGDVLEVVNHEDTTGVLVSDKEVEVDGVTKGIQTWLKEVTGWKAVQTYVFLRKVGDDKTLSELRDEALKEC